MLVRARTRTEYVFPMRIDRPSAAAIIGRFPRYIHQLSSLASSAKNCFVNFQRAEGSSRSVRAAFENKQGKKGKIDASRCAGGGRGIPSPPPLSLYVNRAYTRARVPDACARPCQAYYSSLPLTGNYAEWELSLSKWASIVGDHPHGYAAISTQYGDNRASNRGRDSSSFPPFIHQRLEQTLVRPVFLPSPIPRLITARAHTFLDGRKKAVTTDRHAYTRVYPDEIDEVVPACTSNVDFRETGARQAFLAVADVAADPGELISTCFGRTVDLLPSLCRLTSPLPSRPLLSLPSLHPPPNLSRFLSTVLALPSRPATENHSYDLPSSASSASSRFSIQTRLPFYWRK